MEINIYPVPFENKSVLENLMQLYMYDFSEIADEDIEENGTYNYEYLDLYWIDENRFPFLIMADNKLAGFVLIRKLGNSENLYEMAEFFVMHKYRRKGIGRYAAKTVFNMFKGHWKVSQHPKNHIAYKFWRSVISKYTSGIFTENHEQPNNISIQEFDN